MFDYIFRDYDISKLNYHGKTIIENGKVKQLDVEIMSGDS